MSKKVMELLDPYNGHMRCKVCGCEHFASIRPHTGRYRYGAWECLNNCELPDAHPDKKPVPNETGTPN